MFASAVAFITGLLSPCHLRLDLVNQTNIALHISSRVLVYSCTVSTYSFRCMAYLFTTLVISVDHISHVSLGRCHTGSAVEMFGN